MTDGYSSGSGLGLGLPGAKRLVHELRIESEPGLTQVVIIIKQRSID
jgi:serine/threonine-protein kinase RsbT